MRDWRDRLQKQSIKYAVVALAVANCGGIYLAHERLNRPVAVPAEDTFVAAADYAESAATSLAVRQASAPVESAPAPLAVTSQSLASNDILPALAPLPPLRIEKAPVIPSVPAHAVRLGTSEPRAVRVQRVRQTDRSFDSAFTPDYAALAPYDGHAETAALSETVQEAAATGAVEIRSEAITVDTSLSAGPFPAASSAPSATAPASDAPAPLELPPVQLSVPKDQLPG